MKLLLLAMLAWCAPANQIDTEQVWTGAGIDFRFTSEGNAYALDGTWVSGITFGFNPMPVFDEPTRFAVPPVDPMPTMGIVPDGHHGDPHGQDAPEAGTAALVGLGLMAAGLVRGRR